MDYSINILPKDTKKNKQDNTMKNFYVVNAWVVLPCMTMFSTELSNVTIMLVFYDSIRINQYYVVACIIPYSQGICITS